MHEQWWATLAQPRGWKELYIYLYLSIFCFFTDKLKQKRTKIINMFQKRICHSLRPPLHLHLYIYNLEIEWERYIACCHLLRCLYNILYILWIWYILRHPIQYITNCWVWLLSNYNIKYICTIYTRLDIQCMSSVYL